MSHMLEEKTAKVFLVERATIRGQMLESLKKNGFTEVLGFADIKEALKAMEVETPGWIICNILPDDEVNGFHLLRLCLSLKNFKKTRISFIIDESEEQYLLPAFELGLFSYILKPFNRDAFENWLRTLTNLAKSYNEKDSLISADFLREVLLKEERYQPWLDFEKKLSTMNPTLAKPLLSMALPLYKLGERARAYQIIDQIKILDKNLSKAADELKEQFKNEDREKGIEDELSTSEASAAQGVIKQLAINSCLVIDADRDHLLHMQKTLGEMGVSEVRVYESGDHLLQEIGELKPDLILMDWQLPKIPGPVLIQRLREKNVNSPIVVTSNVLNDNDATFIREFGISAVINKPVESHTLLQSLVWAIQEDKFPQEYASTDYKFRLAVDAHNVSQARTLGKKLLSFQDLNKENRKRIEATLSYLDDDLEKAKALAIEALRHRNDNIFTLGILGKIFLKLKETKSALFCFEKAQILSPLNINRLCQLAELNLDVGDNEGAKNIVSSASDLSDDSPAVQEATTKVALATGDQALAKETMEKLQSFTNVVSFLNNKAIAYAQNDEIEESLKLYHNAIESLPDTQVDVKATVKYNLGMAHVRAQNYTKAKEVLEDALNLGEIKLKPKIENLFNKVSSAIEAGKTLRFAESKKEDAAEEGELVEGEIEVSESSGANIEYQPGDVCCYLLYVDEENKKLDAAKKILAVRMPHFVFRQVIKKTSRFAS